jgi:hypothetical protein
VAGYLRLLAGQSPSAAVFLYARPYEALGNEFSRSFGAGMTQVMQAVEYLPPQGARTYGCGFPADVLQYRFTVVSWMRSVF